MTVFTKFLLYILRHLVEEAEKSIKYQTVHMARNPVNIPLWPRRQLTNIPEKEKESLHK